MKSRLICALIASFSLNAFANTSNSSSENLEQYKRVIVDESTANRERKKYTVNAAISGITFGSRSNSVEAGYYIDRDSVLALQFTDLQGRFLVINFGDDDEDSSVWDQDGRGNSISLSLKKFVSNSFYIKPEVYSRNQTIVDGIDYNTNTISDGGDVEDIGFSFRVGNQWQWEHFTLGCDWIGLTRPLIISKKDKTINTRDLESGSMLNFYMGISF